MTTIVILATLLSMALFTVWSYYKISSSLNNPVVKKINYDPKLIVYKNGRQVKAIKVGKEIKILE